MSVGKQKKQEKSFLQQTWGTDNRVAIKPSLPHERSVIDFDTRILTQIFRSKK